MYDDKNNQELMDLINRGNHICKLVESEGWGLIEECFKRKRNSAHFKLLETNPNDIAKVAKLQVEATLYGDLSNYMGSIINDKNFSEKILLDRGVLLPTAPTSE